MPTLVERPVPTLGRGPLQAPASVARARRSAMPVRPVVSAWPTGLLGMLMLVAVIETLVARRAAVVCGPATLSWRMSAAFAAERAPGRALLFAGDSLIKHGVMPRVVEAGTGRTAVNLAAAHAPAPLTYFVLRRAFDAGARPEAIVLEFKPSMLAGGPRYYLRDWPEVLTPGEMLDLVRESPQSRFVAGLLVGAALPSYRARVDVRADLLAQVRGEVNHVEQLNALCRRHWSVNDGAHVAGIRSGYEGRTTEAEHHEFLSDRFEAQRVNRDYLLRTLELAFARTRRVYVLLPPFAPELHARRVQSGADAGYTGFVEGLQRRFPGLVVLDARGSGYVGSVFVDPSHLDRRGASTLSVDLAEVLRRDLASDRAGAPAGPGRWEHLPAYREVASPVALEDVEQSRVALGMASPR